MGAAASFDEAGNTRTSIRNASIAARKSLRGITESVLAAWNRDELVRHTGAVESSAWTSELETLTCRIVCGCPRSSSTSAV